MKHKKKWKYVPKYKRCYVAASYRCPARIDISRAFTLLGVEPDPEPTLMLLGISAETTDMLDALTSDLDIETVDYCKQLLEQAIQQAYEAYTIPKE